MKQIYEDDATVQQTCDDSRNDNEVTFKVKEDNNFNFLCGMFCISTCSFYL